MRPGSIALLGAAALSGAALFQPRWLIRMAARRFPDVLFSVHTSDPILALTIDDGPDSDVTDELLNVLASLQCRATFFLLASEAVLEKNFQVVHRIVAGGHEIGNHLLGNSAAVKLPPAEFERQLLLAHELLSQFAPIRWFRPGSGWVSREMLAILEKHGYRCALGSIYPYDPHHPFVWYSSSHILRRAYPGGIIVLHDRGNRGKRTAKVLSRVLPLLREKGYRIGTLSELTQA